MEWYLLEYKEPKFSYDTNANKSLDPILKQERFSSPVVQQELILNYNLPRKENSNTVIIYIIDYY